MEDIRGEKVKIYSRNEKLSAVDRLFDIGDVYITSNAFEALTPKDILKGIYRHSRGDWGDLAEQDLIENDLALKNGLRLVSMYTSDNNVEYWIITEADRSVTTILLPIDY